MGATSIRWERMSNILDDGGRDCVREMGAMRPDYSAVHAPMTQAPSAGLTTRLRAGVGIQFSASLGLF